MPCREGKLSGGAFFIALDINHWFSGSILILLGITIGGTDESPHLPDKDRQPFAAVLSRDEIQSLEKNLTVSGSPRTGILVLLRT